MAPDGKAVPKFGSFKARRTTIGLGENEDTGRVHDKHPSATRANEDRQRIPSVSHQRQGDCESSRKSVGSPTSPASRQIAYVDSASRRAPASQNDDDPNMFFSDRKGDKQNVTYGTMDRYSTPRYRRLGAGYVIGCANARIDRDASTDTYLVLQRNQAIRGRGDTRFLSSKKARVADEHRLSSVPANDATCDSSSLHKDYVEFKTDQLSSRDAIVTPKG